MNRDFLRLCELIRDGVIICKDGHVVFANRAACGILARKDLNALHGVPVEDLIEPGDWEILLETVERSENGEDAQEVIVRARGRSSRLEAVAARVTFYGSPAVQVVFRDENGSCAPCLLRGEEAMAWSELVNLANSVIIRWKPPGTVTFFNKFAERFFGYSAAEVVGKNIMMLVPEVDSEGQDLSRLTKEIVQKPDQYATFVNENVRKDGTRVWVSWTNKAIRDDDHRVVEILSVGNDVTAQKEAKDLLKKTRDELAYAVEERTTALRAINAALQQEIRERTATEEALQIKAEELARSNRDLEQFAYAASHDLQEPLRNVTSCVQLLRNRFGDEMGPDAAQLMRYAEESTDRMKSLINGLLNYSRVKTRGNPFEERDSEALLEETLLDLYQALNESGAVVTHDALPKVCVDGSQLSQVFQNLIMNAVKFRGPEQPRIHISARLEGAEWIFSVKDNGIGIEPEYSDKIFVVFRRLHSNSVYPGTGIGLAITKRIIERHGGRIWVESRPGAGSTFCFTLPATRTKCCPSAGPGSGS